MVRDRQRREEQETVVDHGQRLVDLVEEENNGVIYGESNPKYSAPEVFKYNRNKHRYGSYPTSNESSDVIQHASLL